MNGLREKIIGRIKAKGRGYAFTRKDFQGFSSAGSVGKALLRLVGEGMIRRLGRGLFDYPSTSKLLGGELSPDIDQVAQAIARKFRWTIMPHGAIAANQLGLSQQVPARIVYLSDGPSKKVQAGRFTIQFKHARPKEMHAENYSSGLVIQALRYLGKVNVDRKVIDALRRRLPAREKARLVKDTRYAADWICQVARQVAEGRS